eukprot:13709545-Heterocapsa_arctica.AAC.1
MVSRALRLRALVILVILMLPPILPTRPCTSFSARCLVSFPTIGRISGPSVFDHGTCQGGPPHASALLSCPNDLI